MTENNRGGARIGAGRKPLDDPRVTLSIRLPQSLIKKIGENRNAKIEALLKKKYK